jgi:hypothetical protein
MEEREVAFKGRKYEGYVGDRLGSQTIIGKSFRKPTPRGTVTVVPVKCDCGEIRNIPITKCKNSNRCLKCYHDSVPKRFNGINIIILNRAKFGAERRNIQFDITIEDIYNQYIKQDKKCALSGMDIEFVEHSHTTEGNASIDRIDSNLGYTINNIQIIHKHINEMKMAHSQEYFISMCKMIAKHNE